MTQDDSPRKRRPSGDEGAACTKWIVDEVKRRRAGLDWSAERLAEEMTAAGVPWTRDIVVNLENGRRNTLAVHELFALAWVLEVDNPLDLIVPHGRVGAERFPLTPNETATPAQVRAWFAGEPPPRWFTQTPQSPADIRRTLMGAARLLAEEHGGNPHWAGKSAEEIFAEEFAPSLAAFEEKDGRDGRLRPVAQETEPRR